MKRKIGIITFHTAWNYGAVLQCAALTRFLKNKDNSVAVIDYCPDYLRESVLRHPLKEAKKIFGELQDEGMTYRLYRSVRRAARCLLDLRLVPLQLRKRNAYRYFVEQNIPLTHRYSTLAQLRSDPPEMDVYICGSDQLWNAYLTNGTLDPAFFLDFGDENTQRIAYAVSACNICENQRMEFARLMNRLDIISVREEKNRKLLQEWSGKPVQVCPDPTFLLEADVYESMEQEFPTTEPYIFIYLLSREDAADITVRLVEQLRKRKNVSVLDGSPNSFCRISGIKRVSNLSVGEWLYMIHNAEYVITNSFHCLALSLIYKKNIYIVPCHPSRMERLEELTKATGLQKRLLLGENGISEALDNGIDFLGTQKYLKQVKHKAECFLESIL